MLWLNFYLFCLLDGSSKKFKITETLIIGVAKTAGIRFFVVHLIIVSCIRIVGAQLEGAIAL